MRASAVLACAAALEQIAKKEVEFVFNFPGIGQGLVFAVNNRDIPVIQLIVVVLAAFYVFMNILTDLIALLASPRRRIAR